MSSRVVMLVVPTSTSVQPASRRMSGMRKPPPICTCWPRATITSFPLASALSNRNTAAALLFSISAASARTSVLIASTAKGNRCPRLPSSKSISIAEYDWAASFAASQIPCGSGLRPRLVCRIMPVALIIFEIRFRICFVHRCRMSAIHASKDGTAAPFKASARICLIYSDTIEATIGLPSFSMQPERS